MGVTPNVIIQLQYRPSFLQDHYGVYGSMEQIPGPGGGVAKLHMLMERIYNFIVIDLAREHRLPVIDLASSFDIFNPDLYRSQIEPSDKGGELITELVAFVMGNFEFGKSESMI